MLVVEVICPGFWLSVRRCARLEGDDACAGSGATLQYVARRARWMVKRSDVGWAAVGKMIRAGGLRLSKPESGAAGRRRDGRVVWNESGV